MNSTQAYELAAAGAVNTDDAGRSCLNTPAFFPFAQDLAASELRLDLIQTVDGDADFYWRGVRCIDTGAGVLMRVRFRLLNGYYLSNALYPMVSQLNNRGITPELRIPAGGFIGIEAQNTDVATRKLKLIFYGVKRYYLEGK